MGFGDVKLSFLICFALGYPLALFSIVFSVWIGAFVGLAMMVMGRAGLKTHLPFGSFMGALAILFIIFDLEIAFLFPWAVVQNDLSWLGIGAMGLFLALLGVGFIYEWKKGALEWE